MNPQRRFFFLVVCILSFYGEIFGQKNTPNEAGFSGFASVRKTSVPFSLKSNLPYFFQHTDRISAQLHPRFTLLNIPTGSYYPSTLGFFCKKELQLDKITPLPVRLRLGSLEYVNWLEQKPNSRRF